MKHLISVSILFLLLFLLLFSLVHAALPIYDDCENYPTLWRLSNNGGTFSVSSEQARAGTNSYKFKYTSNLPGRRIELIPAPSINLTFGEDYWFGWSVYYPADWENPTSYGVIGQWHIAGYTNCGPGEYDCDNRCCGTASAIAQPLIFYTGGTDAAPQIQGLVSGVSDYWSCDSDCWYDYAFYKNDLYSGVINKGAWNDYIVHYKPVHDSATGVVEAWLNGVKFMNIKNYTAHNDDMGPVLKLGIYASTTKDHVIYIDEIKAMQGGSYDEVAPGGEIYLPPTVSIIPSAAQEIRVGGTVDYSCTATPVAPATIVSYLWTFADSGVSDDAVADPAAKRFWREGTYEVRVTVTDSNELTATAASTVVVGSGAITGRTNNWLMESGAITTDADGNEDLINNGRIAVEQGGGTEMDPPALGTHGVVLNGKNQYFSVAYWNATNPWQTSQPAGTFVVGIKTPAANPAAVKYLAGRYDIGGQRTVSFLLSSSGMQPAINIGISNGTSFETKYLGTNLSTSTRYILFFSVNATAKTWAIRAYNAETTQWLSPATGSISGTMNLAGNAPWNIGRRSDGAGKSYYAGKIYFAQLYNTVLSQGECEKLVSGTYVDPNR